MKDREHPRDCFLSFKGIGVFTLCGEQIGTLKHFGYNVDDLRKDLYAAAIKKIPTDITVEFRHPDYVVIDRGTVIASRAKPFTLEELKEYE